MKWTADNDQLLLLKILETHDITVKASDISAAWPKDREVPTPRAITERLVTIRKLAVKNGSGHFTVSSAQNNRTRSTPSTPRKPRASKATLNGNTTPSSVGKRKRTTSKIKTEADADAEGEDDDDEELGGGVKVNDTNSQNGNGLANGKDINGIDNGSNGELDLEIPTKKLRVSSKVKTEKYTEDVENGEDEEDSEVSEYEDAI